MNACEVCLREKADPKASYVFSDGAELHRLCHAFGRGGNWGVDEACWRLGYERLRESAPEQQAKIEALADEGKWLRRLLFLRHGCDGPSLYGDDGEMQCHACALDFRRMRPEAIEARWRDIGLWKLAAAKATP